MRHATSLQTPFPHMRMRAPPPPYAHTMPTPHAFHLRPYGFYNDVARRVVTKKRTSPRVAWYTHGDDGNGRHLGAMRIAMPTVGAGSSRFLAKIPPPTAPHRGPAPLRYKSQEPSSTLVGGARCAIGQVDDAAIAEARIQQKPYRVVIQWVRISP